MFDNDVPSLDIAKVAKARAKGSQILRLGRTGREKPDPGDFGWLRFRGVPRQSTSAREAETRDVASFDHLIRQRQQRWRDGEAKRLCGLEVDDELELGRLFDG